MTSHVFGEVLVEFKRIGAVVKVSAIHVETDTEVCVVGPSTTGRQVLSTIVTNKLAYVLGKRKDRAQWTDARPLPLNSKRSGPLS